MSSSDKAAIKVMIIDGEADFRTLLMHHVTTHWPDAIISVYDPTEAGHLPDEFSGAGNDLVLLGNSLGDRLGIDVLKTYLKNPGFPALIYFGSKEDGPEVSTTKADGFFERDAIKHDAMVRLTGRYDANAVVSEIVSNYELRAGAARFLSGAMNTGETRKSKN